MSSQTRIRQTGIFYAVGAYLIWGLFPIYWKQLDAVPALQLIGHRIVWSFLLLSAAIILRRKTRSLRVVLDKQTALTYLVAALLISVNWLTYVWAVTHNRMVEASLGYYINPLFSVVLGIVVFGERLRPLQWLPIALAATGVLYLTVRLGSPPWIALALATTFSLYSVVKKMAPLGPALGLTVETGLVFLPALAYLMFCELTGRAAFLHGTARENLMMAGSGLVTAVPLLFFAAAASRVPLTTIGILQYINPTMQFLLGVLVYHEPLSHARLIGFGLVWIALALLWIEGLHDRRVKAGPSHYKTGKDQEIGKG
jgi:chloramphenicol-sensitive protein RarD